MFKFLFGASLATLFWYWIVYILVGFFGPELVGRAIGDMLVQKLMPPESTVTMVGDKMMRTNYQRQSR